MPSSITHALAGLAVGAWLGPASPPRRFWVIAAICGAVPDIDLLGWALHVPNASVVGHRALTHSITFAVAVGAVAAWGAFRDSASSLARHRLWAVLAIGAATHGVLDALTTYSLGIEFFAPFSQHRYRFPWQPLTDPIDGLGRALRNELFWALAPSGGLACLGWRVRRRAGMAPARAPAGKRRR